MNEKGVITIGCFSPLIRVEQVHLWKKAKDGHMYHPAKFFNASDHKTYFEHLSKNREDSVQIIGCGNCIGCRLEKARNKANQGYLEHKEWKYENAWFITLTIDEDHLYIPEEIQYDYTTKKLIINPDQNQNYEITPMTFTPMENQEWTGTLVHKDVQLWMKSLRKYFKKHYDHEGIRLMYCGEYGGTYNRPHYHVILFNAPFPLETFHNPRLKWGKYFYYQNTILESTWDKGFSDISECTWNTIGYVARYITKKINGEQAEWVYGQLGHDKEFYSSSNRPGIGKFYYDKHKDEIYEQDAVLVRNLKGTHLVKPPKYFDTLLKAENPERWEEIQEKRQWQMINNIRLKSQYTSLEPWEQLQLERRTKERQTAILSRDLPEY